MPKPQYSLKLWSVVVIKNKEGLTFNLEMLFIIYAFFLPIELPLYRKLRNFQVKTQKAQAWMHKNDQEMS